MEENKGLLLKCAMSYGLAMGIYWVIKYLFLIFGYSIPSLIFIYEGLSLAVPFIAYYLTKRYRQDIGGSISFFHAWRFGIMLYFFAALIVSIEHFIFFQCQVYLLVIYCHHMSGRTYIQVSDLVFLSTFIFCSSE